MCGELGVSVGSPTSAREQMIKTWEVIPALKGASHWACEYPFGGWARSENTERLEKAKIVGASGEQVNIKVKIQSFVEKGCVIPLSGWAEFRLLKADNIKVGGDWIPNPKGAAWFLMTEAGTHGVKDSQGNVRQPMLVNSPSSV